MDQVDALSQGLPWCAFRERMVKARKAAGLTQRELANRLHKPRSFVAKYEGGERRIDVVEFLTVCQAIGVDSAGLGFWHTHRDFRPRLCT
jgi:transcriptional regulator with XRE-family HTH domain